MGQRNDPRVRRYTVQIVLLVTEDMAGRLDRMVDPAGHDWQVSRAAVAREVLTEGLGVVEADVGITAAQQA